MLKCATIGRPNCTLPRPDEGGHPADSRIGRPAGPHAPTSRDRRNFARCAGTRALHAGIGVPHAARSRVRRLRRGLPDLRFPAPRCRAPQRCPQCARTSAARGRPPVALEDGRSIPAQELWVAREELLAVRASGPRGNPGRRSRTRPYPVMLQSGPYRIHGYLHGPPGADPIRQLARRKPMVPLTEAWIMYQAAGQEHRARGAPLSSTTSCSTGCARPAKRRSPSRACRWSPTWIPGPRISPATSGATPVRAVPVRRDTVLEPRRRPAGHPDSGTTEWPGETRQARERGINPAGSGT